MVPSPFASRFLIAAVFMTSNGFRTSGTTEGSAPVVSDLRIIETSPSPAEVYFSFKVMDADSDLDMAIESPINAGVFCDEAGFAGNSFGRAEKYDPKTGLAHYRAKYSPHRGVGECSFTLVVKDKAANESVPIRSNVSFK